MLFMQMIPCALALDLVNAGRSRAARMAMIAKTTSSSINVNAREPRKANVSAAASWTAPVLWSFCTEAEPIESASGLGKQNWSLRRALAGKHSKTCRPIGRFIGKAAFIYRGVRRIGDTRDLWSAPAKRSGDGALTVPGFGAERAKAGSRFARPRTPNLPAPQPNVAHPTVPSVKRARRESPDR